DALLLAFIAVQTRAGIRCADAGPRAREWLIGHQAGTLPPYFAFNKATGQGIAYGNDDLSFIDLAGALADENPGGWAADPRDGGFKAPNAIAIMHVGAVAGSIEKLYAEAR